MSAEAETPDDVVASCQALEAQLKRALAETSGGRLETAMERSVQISTLVRIAWDIARLSSVSTDDFVASVGKQVRGPEANGPDCGDGRCLDCSIRRVCGFSEGVPVDIQPAIYALGNVLAELLAFLPTRTAKALVAELLVARKKWQAEPRVAAQMPPAGTA